MTKRDENVLAAQSRETEHHRAGLSREHHAVAVGQPGCKAEIFAQPEYGGGITR
jgi:hypothetical protein